MVLEPDTSRLSLKWVDTSGVPARMLGHKGGGLGGPTSMGEENKCQRGRWASQGVDCEIPYRLARRTKHFFIRMWKLLPSRRVLKTSRESSKQSSNRTISPGGGLGPLQSSSDEITTQPSSQRKMKRSTSSSNSTSLIPSLMKVRTQVQQFPQSLTYPGCFASISIIHYSENE